MVRRLVRAVQSYWQAVGDMWLGGWDLFREFCDPGEEYRRK